jgi:hypothetical protein
VELSLSWQVALGYETRHKVCVTVSEAWLRLLVSGGMARIARQKFTGQAKLSQKHDPNTSTTHRSLFTTQTKQPPFSPPVHGLTSLVAYRT